MREHRYDRDMHRYPARQAGPADRYDEWLLDPNYRGGRYRGERMEHGRAWQAPYGQHRLTHTEDLGGFGGYEGVYAQPRPFLLGGPAGHGQDLLPHHSPRGGYGPDFYPREGRISWYDQSYRTEPERHRERGRLPDASRPLRYDDGFNRYGGYNSGGFSDRR